MPKTFKQQKLGFGSQMDLTTVVPAVVAAAGDEREVVVTTTTQTIAIKPKEVQPTIAKKQKKQKKSFTANIAASMNGPPTPLHKLVFSDYISDAMKGVGDNVFLYAKSESPLATKSECQRGAIAERVTKRFMPKEHRWDIAEAKTSADVNGQNRGKGKERYDCLRRMEAPADDRNVEVKVSRYSFDKHDQRWVLKFENVKPELHHDLILVVEGLDGMHLFLWGGQNLSTAGKKTESEGGTIQVRSSCHQPDIDVASVQLMAKMKARNTFLGSVLYTDAAYADLFATTVRSEGFYADSPLSLLSGKARGDVCENLVRAVLARKLGHAVEDAEITDRVDGRSRGASSTTCDFKVDGERAEVKSARVCWDKTHRHYKVAFKNVKIGDFDLLYASFEGPGGVHIFLHDPQNGYSTHGKRTEAEGGQITMNAPGGKGAYTYPPQVEDFLLKQFKWWKSKYLAFVAFGDGDAERLLAAGKEHGTVLGGDGDEEEEEEEE